MPDLLRQEIATAAHTMIVKVGTRVLTGPDGTLSQERIAHLAQEIHEVLDSGRKLVLVSSGAVGAGMGQLGLKKRPTDLAQLQAVAAIGQTYLVQTYDREFRRFGRHAAQILLVADDLDHRTRYLNIRNTILNLLELGAVPIINENDTVSVEELRTTFGDNDRLAAMMTNLIRAPLMVLLSDVQGLYNGDPSLPDSKLVHTVPKIDEGVYGMVRDKLTGLSKGGMASKIEAARIATTAGENVIITSGKVPGALRKIIDGEIVGTLFLAQGGTLPAWKRWIGFTAQTRGILTLDDGARKAVERDGRSLLAIGIRDVAGDFRKGDVVSLRDQTGYEFARGLCNYAHDELHKIKGLRTEQIASALGSHPHDEVIHRDNLARTRADEK
jgi:glutamate 5-kinase